MVSRTEKTSADYPAYPFFRSHFKYFLQEKITFDFGHFPTRGHGLRFALSFGIDFSILLAPLIDLDAVVSCADLSARPCIFYISPQWQTLIFHSLCQGPSIFFLFSSMHKKVISFPVGVTDREFCLST